MYVCQSQIDPTKMLNILANFGYRVISTGTRGPESVQVGRFQGEKAFWWTMEK